METAINVPPYDPAKGLHLDWDDGFEIEVKFQGNEIVIGGNSAGLTSLARHLLALAQTGAPAGAHVHLTANQELESEVDLILQKSTV
ncbi:hypothetical protein EV138_7025 [Kribbella voronezhensis]|uniref:Uncharacterized protein n=1 Tax=Kribbella voronezhensis TaxID=2512212 RepID=A0A4R7T0I9_9ACTN|nr:hypothetical protein [Kribbella voronezhensis]TDU84546.1 hypothetical protein EV138_7025 [Kribbella voronezhensis]